MKKTAIVNKGLAEQGKSDSIKLAAQEIIKRFPNAKCQAYSINGTENLVIESELSFKGDITIIIEIDSLKIGVESQGDPNSRIFQSLPFFAKNECDIILCACRNRGETVWEVDKLHHDFNYDIIWVSNPRSWQKRTEEQCQFMNDLFKDQIIMLIDGIMNKKL